MTKIFHIILYVWLIILPAFFASPLLGQGKGNMDIEAILKRAKHDLDNHQMDSSLHYAQLGLKLSEQVRKHDYSAACLQLIGRANFQKKNIPSALRFYLQSLKVKESFDLQESRDSIHLEIAELYEYWSVYSKAVEHYQKALDLSKGKNSTMEKTALLGMARNEHAEGNPINALNYYQRLRQSYQLERDTAHQIQISKSIIEIFKSQEKFEAALEENLALLQLNEAKKDTAEIILALNNIGVLHRQLNDLENALPYFLRSIELEKAFWPQQNNNATTLTNIGILYQNQRNYQQSLRYLFEAKKVLKSNTPLDIRSLSNINNLIAIIFLSQNDLENAFIYNQEAIDRSEAIGAKDLTQLYYRTRSSIYQQLNNYERALEYYQLHSNLKDSIQSKEQTRRELLLKKQFSAEQTEKEMSLLAIDREIENLKFEQELLENERLLQEQALQKSLLHQEKLERERAEQTLLITQQELEREKSEQQLILTQQKLEAEQKDRLIASLENEQNKKDLEIARQNLLTEQKDKEIAKAAMEKVELEYSYNKRSFDYQAQREASIRNVMIGFLLLSLIILGLIWRTSYIRNKANKILGKRKQEVEDTLNELKHTQSQLIQSGKMASLGQLTAGIAHEINNPVNFVNGNAAALKRDFNDLRPALEGIIQLKNEETREQVLKNLFELDEDLDIQFLIVEIQRLLEGIQRGSSRLAEIVKGMRTFSSDQGEQFIFSNLHEGLDSALTILQSKIKNTAQIHKDYGNLPRVKCQFGKINQVFLNILANAIEAIQELPKDKQPGEVVITTRQFREEVMISIKDTGIGMSPDTLNRMYDPFFTTKEVGKGTGLGMSISYGIIESHGGKIGVNSQLGAGSEFIITLPIEPKATAMLTDEEIKSLNQKV